MTIPARYLLITLCGGAFTIQSVATAQGLELGRVDFDYSRNEVISLDERKGERRVQLVIQRWHPKNRFATVYYREQSLVTGSVETEVVESRFDRKQGVDMDEIGRLISSLMDTGISELPELPPVSDTHEWKNGEWHEHFNLSFSDTGRIWFWNRSFLTEPPRDRVHELLSDFIRDRGLDQPEDPTDVSLVGDGFRILLETSEPVWETDWYEGKNIVDFSAADEDQGMVSVTVSDEAGNSRVLTGIALRSVDGIYRKDGVRFDDLVGKTISYTGTSHSIDISEGDNVVPVSVTLAELLKSPDYFNGRRVRVSGHYLDEYENQKFSDQAGNRVWLGGVSDFAELGTEKVSGKATVDAIFWKGPSGHFGMWFGSLDRITRFQPHPKIDHVIVFSIAGTVGMLLVFGIVFVVKTRFLRRSAKSPIQAK